MRRAALTLVAGLALISSGLANGFATEIDPRDKPATVRRFQQAVRDSDKNWLAAHTRFPLSYFGHRKLIIRDKAGFLRDYPLLIGAQLRATILAQDPESVFENAQGLMIGEGRYNVWVRDTGDGETVRYQIIAINGP
jgi:hypothetical protein